MPPGMGGVDLVDVARQMEGELDIKDRMYHLRKYKRVFVASHAVEWVRLHELRCCRGHGCSERAVSLAMNFSPTSAAERDLTRVRPPGPGVQLVDRGYATSAGDAVVIGRQMQRHGLFDHVTSDHDFKNERLFFRFAQHTHEAGDVWGDFDAALVGASPASSTAPSSRRLSLDSAMSDVAVGPSTAAGRGADGVAHTGESASAGAKHGDDDARHEGRHATHIRQSTRPALEPRVQLRRGEVAALQNRLSSAEAAIHGVHNAVTSLAAHIDALEQRVRETARAVRQRPRPAPSRLLRAVLLGEPVTREDIGEEPLRQVDVLSALFRFLGIVAVFALTLRAAGFGDAAAGDGKAIGLLCCVGAGMWWLREAPAPTGPPLQSLRHPRSSSGGAPRRRRDTSGSFGSTAVGGAGGGAAPGQSASQQGTAASLTAGSDGTETDNSTDDEAVDEEAAKMRRSLATDWPEANDETLFTPSYIASVMNQPDSKHPGHRRSFENAREKLASCLEWRESIHAQDVRPEAVRRQLECGSLYWHGYDVANRPVLWVRPHLKDYSRLDVKAEVALHVLMLDTGVRLMPPGVTEIAIVADAAQLGLRTVSVSLMRALLKVLVTGFPDRLGSLSVGPVNMALRSIYSVLTPLMPKRLPGKIKLMASPGTGLVDLIGAEMIPEFMGGTNSSHATLHCGPGERFSFEEMVRQQRAMLRDLSDGRGSAGAALESAGDGRSGAPE